MSTKHYHAMVLILKDSGIFLITKNSQTYGKRKLNTFLNSFDEVLVLVDYRQSINQRP